MTITEPEAHQLATDTLNAWGSDGPVRCRRLNGGWRCWNETPNDTPATLGSTHVLITDNGTTMRCPSGLLDTAATQLLTTHNTEPTDGTQAQRDDP